MGIESIQHALNSTTSKSDDFYLQHPSSQQGLFSRNDKKYYKQTSKVTLDEQEMNIPKDLHFINCISLECKLPKIPIKKGMGGRFRLKWTKNAAANLFKVKLMNGHKEMLVYEPDSYYMIKSHEISAGKQKVWKELIGNHVDLITPKYNAIPEKKCIVPIFIFSYDSDINKALPAFKFQKKGNLKLSIELEKDISKLLVVEQMVEEMWEVRKLLEYGESARDYIADDYMLTIDMPRKIIDHHIVRDFDLDYFDQLIPSTTLYKNIAMKSDISKNPSVTIDLSNYEGPVMWGVLGAKNVTAHNDYNCRSNFTTFEHEPLGYTPIKVYSMLLGDKILFDRETEENSKLQSFLHSSNCDIDQGLHFINFNDNISDYVNGSIEFGSTKAKITCNLGESFGYGDDTKKDNLSNQYQVILACVAPVIYDDINGEMVQRQVQK